MSAALVDRYAIERQIGVGGMATVYLARDLRHDRQVALKLLRPELGAVIGADRFLAEIKLTANLQHPHILPLFDSGTADGLLFYVMPYIQGVSLRDRLTQEKQISVPEAVRIATEVASALDYAHRHGVIHRDIKPENILLHDGQALVADFGIALALSTAGSTRMTETGMSLGTPHYMSPEQAMGEREITGRSDVYALGAVLYEMLAGEPPFTGPTAQAIVAKVLTEDPRPLVPKRHTIPPHVEAAVLTALEKLPADRYATPAQFAQALADTNSTHASRGKTAVVRGAGRKGNRRDLLIGCSALATGLALGFLGTVLTGRDDAAYSPTVSRFVISTPNDHRLTGSPLATIALSPDGSTVVYVGQNSRGIQLYQRRLDELAIHAIPGTEGGQNPIFSPDGKWLGFVTPSGGKKVPLTGGAPVAFSAGILPIVTAVWLDAQEFLATGLDGKIHRIAPDGTTSVIASPDSTKGEESLLVSDVLPGGEWVLVIAAPGAGVTGRAYAINVKDGKRRLVIDQIVAGVAHHPGFLAWVDQEGNLLGAEFDADEMRIKGTPLTLAQAVRTSVGGPPQFAVSDNGALAYVPQTPFDLVLVSRDGRAERVANVQRRFHSPRFSPDGGRIAMDFIQSGARDIWTLDLRDKTLSRLTFEKDGHDPVWSPDGRRIAYASARGGVIGMFLRNADGSGTAESLYVGPTSRTVGDFFPAGDRAVSIVTGPDGSFDLAIRSLAGARGEEQLLASPFNEGYPAISPDGRWLAYQSDESGQGEVYVRPLIGPGGKVLVSQNGGSEPVWSRTTGELFYRGFGDTGIPLIAARLENSPTLRVVSRTTLFDVSDYEAASPHANYDVDRSGRFVMVNQGRLSQIVVIQNWHEEVRRRGPAGSK